MAATGNGDVGTDVFLDLVNPVAALEDPAVVVERSAPLAHAGHVKDYVFRSIPTDDGYHRHGSRCSTAIRARARSISRACSRRFGADRRVGTST